MIGQRHSFTEYRRREISLTKEHSSDQSWCRFTSCPGKCKDDPCDNTRDGNRQNYLKYRFKFRCSKGEGSFLQGNWNSFQRYLPSSIFDEFMALPYHLFILSTQHHDIEGVRPLAYGTALVLIGLVFTLNIIAFIIRAKYRKRNA
jgi:hypothetical protein